MYLVINKCVTAVKVSNFSGHYLRNRSTLDIGVLGYIGIVQHKEHSPEVLSIPPGTPCIYQSLHVSGDYVPIIKRNNRIYTTLGTFYSVLMTVCMPESHSQLFLLMMGTQSPETCRD